MADCIVLSFSESFAMPGMVAAATAAAHADDDVVVVVATTGLRHESRERIESAVAAQGNSVRFVDSNRWVAGLPRISRYVQDTWTRVFTAEFLEGRYRRALYLDADTMTLGSLTPLFEVPIDGALLALRDPVYPTFGHRSREFPVESGLPAGSPYFNTGVLVIECGRWTGVGSAAMPIIDAGRLPMDYVDQDVLNVVMANRWSELGTEWHHLIDTEDDHSDAAIVHFTGPVKPWRASGGGALLRRYRAACSELSWIW